MSNIVEKTFSEIGLGESAEFEVLVDEDLVQKFIALTGDVNPLHTDTAYAATTVFGARVAHGMIGGALFSRLIGMVLPGKYALFLEQTVQFKKPVYIGTNVIISGVVTKKVEAFQVIELQLMMKDRNTGDTLIEGKALVKVLR